MKITVEETDEEYKMIKDMPYKDLLTIDTLISVAFLFFILILVKLYILIPIILFFTIIATLQTLEDNFSVIVKKRNKEVAVSKYYLGRWKYKTVTFLASEYSSVQVEKQVTSMRDDGRFSINFLTIPTDAENHEKDNKVFVLMKNLDLEDIEQAKVLSFMLDLLYEKKIKYKAELS